MSRRLTIAIGAAGLAGHALPAIALGRELKRRGHDVVVHTYERWRPTVEQLGLGFDGAEQALAGEGDGLVAEARALATRFTETSPDIVVSDALTLSPALAAELRGVPSALLYPEVYPHHALGLPFFSLGLFAPRTRLGAAGWRAADPVLATRLPTTGWLGWARRRLDGQRRELGLAPRPRDELPIAADLTLVATLPQLEYPRRWPAGVHVTGPMILDPPHPPLELPPGDDPLVLIAPSTVKDREGRLARVALAALADLPVRVVLTTSGSGWRPRGPVPRNAVVADWVDYPQLMGAASLVICHGNHGTLVRALSEGLPVIVTPAMPDDAEHGARVAWAGAGLMVPKRLLGRRTLRAAIGRALDEPALRECAAAIAAWSSEHDGASRGADLIEDAVPG
jgi:UDP:flavonoid glycosyltransferase YjiC (YdhE family)